MPVRHSRFEADFVKVLDERTVFMVLSRSLSRTCAALGAIALVSAAVISTRALASSPATTDALVLPGPNQFVSGLDLECFDTPLPNQPLNTNVQLTHLNPVLVQLGLPVHVVTVRELQQTCVPVQKNGVSPAAAALPFIQQVDLACFRIEAVPLAAPLTLTLKHLNPVLIHMNLPAHKVALIQPVQLCVPVSKNGVVPTPDVLRLIQSIDLECWKVDAGAHPAFTVNLKQLNPQLGHIQPHNLNLVPQPRQMCVPVQKNNQLIPTDVLNVVRWIDLEKFTATPIVTAPSVQVVLKHLNPLFASFPSLTVKIERASALMVPVTKNGATPPPP